MEAHMALPKAYLTSSKNVKAILAAIQTAQAPSRFTTRFLASLEFKSVSDRLIIGVLKSLGFLRDDGSPTQRYFTFLDQTQSAKVLAEGIREAYADLFQINVNAQRLTKQELVNKFKTISQGQLSPSVLDKLSMTFIELVKHADFSGAPHPVATAHKEDDSQPEEERRATARQNGGLQIDGLVYNIQIVLPESRDPAVYDALFRSLREHLQ
jgi:hypothetical protein